MTDVDKGAANDTFAMKVTWKDLNEGKSFNFYHVEARAEGQKEWTLCDKDNTYLKIASIQNCTATVDALPRNSKYQLRIIAVVAVQVRIISN